MATGAARSRGRSRLDSVDFNALGNLVQAIPTGLPPARAGAAARASHWNPAERGTARPALQKEWSQPFGRALSVLQGVVPGVRVNSDLAVRDQQLISNGVRQALACSSVRLGRPTL